MTAPLDNPAQRLADILLPMSGRDAADNGGLALAEQIGRTWPDEREHVVRAAAEMIAMGREVRQRIESYEDEDPTLVLETFNQVEETLAHFSALGAYNIQQIFGPLKADGKYGLRIAASVLHRREPEPVLSSETHTSLREQLQSLMNNVVSDSSLQDDDKSWLLDRLRGVAEALDDIAVYGVRRVEAATDQLVGAVRRAPLWRLSRMAESPVLKGVAALLAALSIALTDAAQVKELVAPPADDPVPNVVVELYQQSGGYYAPQLPPADEGGSDPDAPAGH